MRVTEDNRRQRATLGNGGAYMDLLEYYSAHSGRNCRDGGWAPDGEHLSCPLPSNCSSRLRQNTKVTFQKKKNDSQPANLLATHNSKTAKPSTGLSVYLRKTF